MAAERYPAILVVEADEALRLQMAETLTAGGYAVFEADTAAEGLQQFRQHQSQIAVTIIEMVMPDASGLDLAAELERMQPGIRVLYMSALPESIAMESIARRSPHHVLLKPFTAVELRERVESLRGEITKLNVDEAKPGQYSRRAG